MNENQPIDPTSADERAVDPTSADERAVDPTSADEQGSDEQAADEQDGAPIVQETLYVRRRRRPTLITWVVAALLLPGIVGLAISPLLDLDAANEAVNMALFLMVAAGLPLATIACIVDMVIHRRSR